ncbi:maleylpyruvate isomerase family mycothiol-dependent enzyme [Streptomyces sp. NBC_00083]|uniref:maleylpyruvate isomerase family mycothiol-dependent enzyme n=1 Tax=Streptomyces sp. NBC_00083 TaxID=2975647 RepID=UPI00225A6A8B|nr:maleylpyruvate isomerase family mycothiol-dependent enzyme [Streptomyces sp. NBC_00083]MCX5384089.1 maleylpyruvate isomerase family mycothiol-dependent enzyme [Streptomyces sp. NBC_00083]
MDRDNGVDGRMGDDRGDDMDRAAAERAGGAMGGGATTGAGGGADTDTNAGGGAGTSLDPRWVSEPAIHCAAVLTETARFVTAVEGADLATPVPSCPGWSLVDLIRHTGSVQRMFSGLLRKGVQERPLSRDTDLDLPSTDDGYPAWLTASAQVADHVFADTTLDAPMWVWGADAHARFWVRRMLFETLVHRVDAELALGLRPVIDPALAADGVDEFLVNLPFAASFAPKTAQLRGADQSIRFRCADRAGDWLVRLRPDGFGLDPSPADAADTRHADATVEGTAADLLLFLYGRLDLTAQAITTSGDDALLGRWVENSAF